MLEQIVNEKAHVELQELRHLVDEKDAELRELRSSWNEREKRLEQLETQRVFYEEELSNIGHQYQTLLDKLSFVITDYSVRTAPIQVRVGGGYELLSTYLNRIFDEQTKLKSQYDRTVPHSPAVMNKYSPEKPATPKRVEAVKEAAFTFKGTPGKAKTPSKAKASPKPAKKSRSPPMVQPAQSPVTNKNSPSKSSMQKSESAPWYEPLRSKQMSWAQGLRGSSPGK